MIIYSSAEQNVAMLTALLYLPILTMLFLCIYNSVHDDLWSVYC